MDEAIQKILEHEGGYVVDQGGPTNFGITLPIYKEYCVANNMQYAQGNLKNIKEKDAYLIYAWLFWRYKIDKVISPDVAYLLFDCCVNHGPKWPGMWVQQILKLKVDGVIGPNTLSAINKADSTFLYYEVLKKRIVFYGAITQDNPSRNLASLEGWLVRACSFIKGDIK